MSLATYAICIALGLILAMIGLMQIGWRVGKKFIDDSTKPANVGAIQGAIFALLGLLIAFTFSNGISRFDDRRKLIVEEANIIDTAFLRIELLPQEAQPEMRNLFRSYLDSRLAAYLHIPDLKAAKTELDLGRQLQRQIWSHAVNHCQAQPTPCTMLLLPALNSMIEITTTRTMMSQFHPPMIIFILLIGFSLVAALLAGYEMAGGSRSWVHIIGFSLVLTMTVYVILDVEYPRIGFIRIDQTDQVLIDLRNSMN
jgi:hypothetical protein